MRKVYRQGPGPSAAFMRADAARRERAQHQRGQHYRNLVAYHEAAHAISYVSFGATIERLSCDGPPPGRSHSDFDGYCQASGVNRIGDFAALVCALAGEAADEAFFSRRHGEWSDDRRQAWRLSHEVDDNDATEVIAGAWTRAGELIQKNAHVIGSLAGRLNEIGEMSGAEVAAWMRGYRICAVPASAPAAPRSLADVKVGSFVTDRIDGRVRSLSAPASSPYTATRLAGLRHQGGWRPFYPEYDGCR
jgi:hypothetical protein